MYSRLYKARSLFEDIAPRSAHVNADADIPESFDLLIDAEGVEALGCGFKTEGDLRETPSRFESSGSFTLERSRPEETHEITVLDDEPLAVRGNHTVPVGSRTAALVGSSEAVQATLESLLTDASASVGADVNVEMRTYESERERLSGTTLDVDYVARPDGLVSFGAEAGRGLRVEEATVTAARGDATAADWRFDLRDHGRLFAGGLADRVRGSAYGIHEARRASGFGETVDWRVRASEGKLFAEVSYEAENVSGYVDELRRRGFETPSRTSLSLEYDRDDRGTTLSVDLGTDGDTDPGTRDDLGALLAFVPSPLASAVSYIS